MKDVYVAFRRSLSEGTEVFHNNIRERWSLNEPGVVNAMREWASYSEQGWSALLNGDRAKLHQLINGNDLRAPLYTQSQGNREMIAAARNVGASSNFAGSGGAVVGLCEGNAIFEKLKQEMAILDVAVIRPQIAPLAPKTQLSVQRG